MTLHPGQAMEFAVLARGEPLELITPTKAARPWWDFFMLNYLSIMLGGALGTGARFWLSGLIATRYGEVFPLGTLLVNITGCFLV